MAKKDSKNGGVARIYTADTHSHIIFGAAYALKMESPERQLTEIVARVLQLYKIEMTTDAGLRLYYRIENLYLENGGI